MKDRGKGRQPDRFSQTTRDGPDAGSPPRGYVTHDIGEGAEDWFGLLWRQHRDPYVLGRSADVVLPNNHDVDKTQELRHQPYTAWPPMPPLGPPINVRPRHWPISGVAIDPTRLKSVARPKFLPPDIKGGNGGFWYPMDRGQGPSAHPDIERALYPCCIPRIAASYINGAGNTCNVLTMLTNPG